MVRFQYVDWWKKKKKRERGIERVGFVVWALGRKTW
jgi:hypothetical protein